MILRTGCGREVEQMRDVMKRCMSGAPRSCMARVVRDVEIFFTSHMYTTKVS